MSTENNNTQSYINEKILFNFQGNKNANYLAQNKGLIGENFNEYINNNLIENINDMKEKFLKNRNNRNILKNKNSIYNNFDKLNLKNNIGLEINDFLRDENKKYNDSLGNKSNSRSNSRNKSFFNSKEDKWKNIPISSIIPERFLLLKQEGIFY